MCAEKGAAPAEKGWSCCNLLLPSHDADDDDDGDSLCDRPSWPTAIVSRSGGRTLTHETGQGTIRDAIGDESLTFSGLNLPEASLLRWYLSCLVLAASWRHLLPPTDY